MLSSGFSALFVGDILRSLGSEIEEIMSAPGRGEEAKEKRKAFSPPPPPGGEEKEKAGEENKRRRAPRGKKTREDNKKTSPLSLPSPRRCFLWFLAFGPHPRRHGRTQLEKMDRMDSRRSPGTGFERVLAGAVRGGVRPPHQAPCPSPSRRPSWKSPGRGRKSPSPEEAAILALKK